LKKNPCDLLTFICESSIYLPQSENSIFLLHLLNRPIFHGWFRQGFWLMWHHIRHASMVSRQLLGGKSDYVNCSGGQIDFIIKITKINFQNVCKCFFENLCNLKSLIRFNIKHPYKFCLAQKNWYQFYFCFIESCSILYMMHVLKLFELYTVSFLCLFGHRCSYFLLLSHFDVYSVIDALIIY
jgi:hypothetical protein